MRKKLGEILTASGAVTQADLDAALSDQTAGEPARLGDLLVALGKITPLQLARALSSQHALPFVQLPLIPDEVVKVIPLEFQRQHRLIPFRVQGESMAIAMADPANTDAIDQLRAQTKKRITRYVAASDDIEGKHVDALGVPPTAGTPASADLFAAPSEEDEMFAGLNLEPEPPPVPAALAIAPVRAVPPAPAVRAAVPPVAAVKSLPTKIAEKVPSPAQTQAPSPITAAVPAQPKAVLSQAPATGLLKAAPPSQAPATATASPKAAPPSQAPATASPKAAPPSQAPATVSSKAASPSHAPVTALPRAAALTQVPAVPKAPATRPATPVAPRPVAPAVAPAVQPTIPAVTTLHQPATSPPPVERTLIEDLPGEQSGLNELFASLSPEPAPAPAAARAREEEDEPAFFEAVPLKAVPLKAVALKAVAPSAVALGPDLRLSEDVSFEVPASEGLTSSPSGTFQLTDADMLEPAGAESSDSFDISMGDSSPLATGAPADAVNSFELSVDEPSGAVEPPGSFEVSLGESSGEFPLPPPQESAPFELSVSESSGDFGASERFELSTTDDERGLDEAFPAVASPNAEVQESSGSFEVSLDGAPVGSSEFDDLFAPMTLASSSPGDARAFSSQAEEVLTLEELPEELSPEAQPSEFPFAPPPPLVGQSAPEFEVPGFEASPALEYPAPEFEVPGFEASPAPAPAPATSGTLPSWLSPSAAAPPPAAAAAQGPGLLLQPGEWTGALDDVAPSRLIAATVKALLRKGLLTEAEILAAVARKE